MLLGEIIHKANVPDFAGLPAAREFPRAAKASFSVIRHFSYLYIIRD